MKTIILNILLITPCLFGNHGNRIESLRNDLLDKMQQLSDLGKELTRKQEYISSIKSEAKTILELIRQELNDDEKKELSREINVFNERAEEALTSGNVKSFLAIELFNNRYNDLERVKFKIVQAFIEQQILKELVQKYEGLLQELLVIDSTIDIVQ